MPSDRCGCGRPATHAGYCSARRAERQSPAGLREGLQAIEEVHLAATRFEAWRSRWSACGRPTSGLTASSDEDGE
jgi:hypothetical protein